jgi:membrane-bound serine protease (ClpP class)
VKSRFLRAFVALLAGTAALGLSAASAQTTAPRVLAVEFKNDVNPVTADYVMDEIERANDDGFDAVVILLDTPGGLADAMKDIYQAELASRTPVITYVSPDGARAASAGVWIVQAADLAAKSLRALAETHGRNGDWAEQAVRKADNLTAQEALEKNVIDEVAPTLPALLEKIDGRRTKPDGKVLDTAGARIERVEMSLWKRILDTIIDPNIILLLMSIGVLGITVELLNPGLIFPGTVGSISLIVGLFGLQVLPISWAGLLLMLLAAGFFAAELFVPSHGALTLAGAVSFVLGSLLLFDPAGDAYEVSVPVVLAIAGTLAALFGVAFAKALQARRAKPQTGADELANRIGVVRQTLDPEGFVFVNGELWRARAANGHIPAGETVRVARVDDGLVLEVERAEEPLAAETPAS